MSLYFLGVWRDGTQSREQPGCEDAKPQPPASSAFDTTSRCSQPYTASFWCPACSVPTQSFICLVFPVFTCVSSICHVYRNTSTNSHDGSSFISPEAPSATQSFSATWSTHPHSSTSWEPVICVIPRQLQKTLSVWWRRETTNNCSR